MHTFKPSLEPRGAEAVTGKQTIFTLRSGVSRPAQRLFLQRDLNLRQINDGRQGDGVRSARPAVTSSRSTSAPPSRPHQPRWPGSAGGSRLGAKQGHRPPAAAPTPPGPRTQPRQKVPGLGAAVGAPQLRRRHPGGR